MRRVDIAHAGQTVPEAMEQLIREIKNVRPGGETVLLVVHGFGASGSGGAIKAALAAELPGLARRYRFRAFGYADRDRIPRERNIDPRSLSQGSTLLVFPEVDTDRKTTQEFRPNFRNLRAKVKVRRRRAT
ncbi:MAG: hypothetical protein ABI401_05860 [Candidatus Dormibacter sp.]